VARIATVDEAYPYAGIEEGAAKVDREFFGQLLDAAEDYCERQLTRTFAPLPAPVDGADTGTPVTKRFNARGRNSITVPDLRSITTITLDGVTLTEGSGYQLGSYEEPSTWIDLDPSRLILGTARQELAIEGRWGFWPVAPWKAKEGILVLAARAYRRRDAGWQDMLTTEDGSTTIFASDLPTETKQMFEAFRHYKLAVV